MCDYTARKIKSQQIKGKNEIYPNLVAGCLHSIIGGKMGMCPLDVVW